MIKTDSGTRKPSLCAPWRAQAGIAAALLLTSTVVGCESVMDVTLPGQVLDADLNDPALARTLAASAQGEFECTLSYYAVLTGAWAGETFAASHGTTGYLMWAVRSPGVNSRAETECDLPIVSIGHVWAPLHIARVQAESAIERIESFPPEEVPDKDFLIGKANAYGGYAYTLLGEAFCEQYFDAGPQTTREAAWRLAEERFTSALEYTGRVTSGPDAVEARSLYNMALVGRARALLNLGDAEGVLRDASEVPEDFVRYAERSEAGLRRYNLLYSINNIRGVASVHFDYHDLDVEGVPDPRVPTSFQGTGADGISPWWIQHKYSSLGADIPIASWREAQLMIAEVAGGQTAVDVINRLRATYDLPEFSSSDPAAIDEQVLEERRRELWMQGTRLGDMLRHDLPFLTGATPAGTPYTDGMTCVPTPDTEVVGNPNI